MYTVADDNQVTLNLESCYKSQVDRTCLCVDTRMRQKCKLEMGLRIFISERWKNIIPQADI